MIFRRKPCEACAAKDRELDRVWSMLTSSRTIIREPDVVQIVEPPKGSRRVPEEHAQPLPEVFSRNPITYDVMQPTEAEDGPVGEDVASEVMRLNAERRARIAARRES